ncbi:MAG: alpha/beta hydrolase [Lachnospiraceae bacterium]|nr:alpha/beta hydrolase [Lachnospiraceae bacterium]
MRYFQVNVRRQPTEHGYMPTMQLYLLDKVKKRRPLVLIAPGGGYTALCTDTDGDRIAMQYNAAGFHAAVLYYSVKPHYFPEPQKDLLLAIRLLRENAEEWGILEDGIAICGFSAGGHLCASVSTLWQYAGEDGELDTKRGAVIQECTMDISVSNHAANSVCMIEEQPVDAGSTKRNDSCPSLLYHPNAAILCYAILTTRLGHCRDFLRSHVNDDAKKLYMASCDAQVSEYTPPTFLYGTFEDRLANVENILYYSEQLVKYGVPFESHIFPKGNHGASWCDDTIWAKQAWDRDYNYIRLSVEWLADLFGLL